MACTVSEQLTAYMDGELAAEARADVDRHLGTCEDCRAELVLLQSLAPRLAQVPVLEPSPQLRREILNHLPPRKRFWSFLRLPVLVPVGGLAVAAGALLVLRAGHPAQPAPDDLALAQNLEVVENLGAAETADLSDEDLEAVAMLDQLEAKKE